MQSQRDSETSRQQSPELRLAAVLLLAETLNMRDPSTARHASTVELHRHAEVEARILAMADAYET